MADLPDVEAASEWRQIEIVEDAEQKVEAACIGRVGVEDIATLAEEDAGAGLLTLEAPGLAGLLELLLGPEVVLDRGDVAVEGHMEVVVEATAER